ncbi:hypothetical protein A1Q1_04525 [Trichosporon asahii var. asahii CBS 2479]|uniref:Integrase catalytic domain-containing protein n=1 Tax=Trichosporon asahii var. asahii (strain ATCC 90039 / CBS 2479 / JCM 2466 / KCTC 7840 / NBRC 103889/ NCYC 2677 / UAMH 7654) TaxID=1186058 RepID=J6F5J6_TRIAS|nr:hypothetical protein A1Q1_04525 [Trichosporon asahii var. asahii CBS 2479]EJT52314.1 hypothetical protein A1Q1_04525 [Trichosporon asahii var. asahii CBS 2479]
MSSEVVERPGLRYFRPSKPSADLSDQDIIEMEGIFDLELVPIATWLNAEPRDRDYSLLGDYIRMAEDLVHGWEDYYSAVPRDKFTELHRDFQMILANLSAQQSFINEGIDPRDHFMVRLKSLPGQQGAPRLNLDIAHLLYLLSIPDMTYAQIAPIAMCSERTVRRRAKELGVNRRNMTVITDEDLDKAIKAAYLRGSGDQGYRAIHTYLLEGGIHVPQKRVAEACRRLNPSGTWDRWIRARLRRVYRVPWINSLWHIDGHHKLNPWKIVIHGGVDGFSRRVVFLRASSNNLAATVEDCFLEATTLWGWPSRVRVDYGGENLGVKKRLEEVRGTVDSKGRWRGTFIQGPSTRNQRIERMWVDVQGFCTSRYRDLFHKLESLGYMSSSNNLDLWALHYVYLPVLNEALKSFCDVWDKHRIRTAGNKSPAKLWAENQELARRVNINAIQYFDTLESLHVQEDREHLDIPDDQTMQFFEDYGVDDYGRRRDAVPSRPDPHVEVPPPEEGLPRDQRELLYDPQFLSSLAQAIGAVWPPDESNGVPQYLQCRAMVYARLGIDLPLPQWWNH